jgi:phosphoglycerate dehydrogenase-like enzyme
VPDLEEPGIEGPGIALLPDGDRTWLAEAITAGGGRLVHEAEAEGLVWTAPGQPRELAELLARHPGIRWIQLPWAGVEPYIETIRVHADRDWTCAKGAFAEPVAELALTLLLAGFRGLGTYARATTWHGPIGRNLLGARVVVVGGGGIAESLLRLLGPFGCDVTVVRRRSTPMPGTTRVVGIDELDPSLDGADALVLALALTPQTRGIIDRRRLDLLAEHAWLVNVARGNHVITDDLVSALVEGSIGGAGLDVTDPEPLPDGHPLWALPNVLLTPHVGDTPEMAVPLLGARVRENVRRWAAGMPLVGPVDPLAGY